MSTTLDHEQAFNAANEELVAANEELVAANEALEDAVRRIRRAWLATLKARLNLIKPDKRAGYLARVAFNNRATWSGGATSATNISETAARSAALELLQSEVK